MTQNELSYVLPMHRCIRPFNIIHAFSPSDVSTADRKNPGAHKFHNLLSALSRENWQNRFDQTITRNNGSGNTCDDRRHVLHLLSISRQCVQRWKAVGHRQRSLGTSQYEWLSFGDMSHYRDARVERGVVHSCGHSRLVTNVPSNFFKYMCA